MMVGDEWAIWPSWVVPRESPPVPSLDGSFVYKDENREPREENSKERFSLLEMRLLSPTLLFRNMEATCLKS
jgi:hypothetical protein